RARTVESAARATFWAHGEPGAPTQSAVIAMTAGVLDIVPLRLDIVPLRWRGAGGVARKPEGRPLLLLGRGHDSAALRRRDITEHRLAPPIDVGPLAVPDAVLVRRDVDHVPTPLRRRQALVAL